MIITNIEERDELENLIRKNQKRIDEEKEKLKDRVHNLEIKNTIKSLRKIEECTLIIEMLNTYKKKGAIAI